MTLGPAKYRVVEPPPSFLDLRDKTFPDIPYWIGPMFLPKSGKLLLGGEAKIGKSWAVLELIRALATGQSAFGHDDFNVSAPCKVLFLEQEVKERGLKERVVDAFVRGPDPLTDEEIGRIYYVSGDPRVCISEDSGRRFILDNVKHVQPNVIVLDPISKMHFYNESDATEISMLFAFFDFLIHEFKDLELSVVFTHHYKKPPTQRDETYDPLEPYNFRGSTKWKDDPDTIMTLKRMKNIRAGHEAWRCHSRIVFRQAASPPEAVYTFNAENDRRGLFDHLVEVPSSIVPELGKRSAGDLPAVAEPRRASRFAPG